MAVVLITSEYFGRYDDTARQMLADAGHTVTDNPYGHKFLSSEEIIPYIKDADAIICDLEKINADVLRAAPRLKAVSRRGVGVDSVDTAYCRDHGIAVFRTPGLVAAPVAELVMTYILMFSRKVDVNDRFMQAGRWEKTVGTSVAGKTLGIVGFGAIGQEVAARAAGFGMRILYYDLLPSPDKAQRWKAEYVQLDELLQNSDFVTLHVPLDERTRDLMDARRIRQMKPSAFLINTARGGIVNESDLAAALTERRLAGAAVDVFDVEPKTDSPLKGLNNTYLTPHIATFTKETFVAMDIQAAKNLIDYFEKGAGADG